MHSRLEGFMNAINKNAFVTHANKLLSDKFDISDTSLLDSTGYVLNLSLTMILVIARACLPRHPDTPAPQQKPMNTMPSLEAATMQFLHAYFRTILFPAF